MWEIVRKITSTIANCNNSSWKGLSKAKYKISVSGTTYNLGNYETQFEMHVVDNLKHNVVLGLDFLKSANAIINTKDDNIILTNNNKTAVHKLINLPQYDKLTSVIAPNFCANSA